MSWFRHLAFPGSATLRSLLPLALLLVAACGGGGDYATDDGSGADSGGGSGGAPQASDTYRCGAYPCDAAILTIENATTQTITESGWRPSGTGPWSVYDWTDAGSSAGIRPGLHTFLIWVVLESGAYDVYARGTGGLDVQLSGLLLKDPKTHFYVRPDGQAELR